MTVKELREALADLPDTAQVVIAKDAEGNTYSPLAELQAGWYAPDTTWAGEWYPTKQAGPSGKQRAVCLWPVN